MSERRDVVIVGGGPGGAATALALARLDPGLVDRVLLLDAARFPRDKTCAGGLLPHALDLLRGLGIELRVPAARVDAVRVEAGGAPIRLRAPSCCWVIRRREFDAMMLDAVRSLGVEVREGVKVLGAARGAAGGIELATEAGEIRCRAVVGADGVGSVVRRSLVSRETGWLARASTCDVEAADGRLADFYEFDFRPVFEGVPGYAWSFPCLVDGRPHWNVGVYSLARLHQGERIRVLLAARVAGAEGVRVRAHAIRLFERAGPFSAPGALLVGDAAGVDPLLGEGISCAIEYGELAAIELVGALGSGCFDFDGYGARVRRSPLGRKLARLALGARLFYGRRARFWFGLARLSSRAQRIGMNWYNGVGSHGSPGPLAMAAGRSLD